MPARRRRRPRHRVFLGVAGAEGLGDPLVGGILLPVDAVRVDLEQDRDALPGAAGDLGRAPRSSATATPQRAAGRRAAAER